MQATRAFRWAGDKLAIGAGGSFGASSNKGAGEINSFNGAGPATLSLSIVTSPLFSNWSGDDREIDNTPRSAPSSHTQLFACHIFPKRKKLAIRRDQPATSIDQSPKSSQKYLKFQLPRAPRAACSNFCVGYPRMV